MASGPSRQPQRRPASEADTDWARKIHHAAVRDVVERQFGGWDAKQQDDFFQRDWRSGVFDVIEIDGDPCGYVCIEDRPYDVHVREIVIATPFQNMGIGTSIVIEAIDRARRRGVPVLLGTLHRNRAAALYRRLGFADVGRDETHTHFRLDP